MPKHILSTVAIALVSYVHAADQVTWPSMQEGCEPHTEMTTNITLHANYERMREFRIRLQAANIISNEIIVAIGADSNEDGDLSFDETAFAFCYDCGERKFVDYRTQTITEVSSESIGVRKRHFDPSWNIAKLIRRGRGDIGETITETVDNLKFEIRLR